MSAIGTNKFIDPRILAERPLPRDAKTAKRDQSGKKKRSVRSVTVNLAESSMVWLHARGHLTDRQYASAEKLRADWERANLSPSITMSWNIIPPTGGRRAAPEMLSPTETQIAAKQRFDNALVYLGADLSDIAWRIICAGEAMPVAEKNLHWPARSGKLVLKIALNRLGDFYRLP
ncbi:MAG: DUF6456 domain-containing protein [Parasphingorhabdus sp.]|uniref:DUF6456 domain-containing protein n=1 Tax=Parasphingorhabdus sp. TaxID=2709688 RepID=UPI0030031F5E